MSQEKFVVSKGYRSYPLTLKQIFEYAILRFPTVEIVCANQRYTYEQFYERIRKLIGTLQRLGVNKGETVGVLDWNTHWNMELGFAVPLYGAIYHPINPRVPLDQIAYMINQAEDRILFFNEEFSSSIEMLKDKLKTVEKYVVLTTKEDLESNVKNLLNYEILMREGDVHRLPELEENAVGWIYYTSGTTGLPKGAYFTHKMAFLHIISLYVTFVNNYKMNSDDVVLHAVPMFHQFSWSYPYFALLCGQKQVLLERVRPEIFWKLVEREKVTWSAFVPTVLRILIDYPKINEHDISSLRLIGIGGAPLPRGLYEEAREKLRELGAKNLEIYAQSGMTELFTYGTSSTLKKHMEQWPENKKIEYRIKTGLPVFLMQVRLVNDKMEDIPRDSKTVGNLFYRAPFITPGYIYEPQKSETVWVNGWFNTGDLAKWDKEGYIQIVDREKDAIKSGGEWISSIVLEDIISMHPCVSEVAVIGTFHEKWDERPVALVKLKSECKGKVDESSFRTYLENFVPLRIPRWWMPDKFVFVEEIAKTSTGKFDKKTLRERYWMVLKES